MTHADVPVEIERLLTQGGRTYVLPVRLPNPIPSLRVGMTLSGVPIDPWFTEIDVDGERRTAFVINPNARPYLLKAGQVVTLEDGRWSVQRFRREIGRIRQLEWPHSIPRTVAIGVTMAVFYTVIAAVGLIRAALSDVAPASWSDRNPVAILAAVSFVYFVLALLLGAVVGIALPFVRDRDGAKLLGAIVGGLAYLSFVPLYESVEPETGILFTVVCAVGLGAVIGGSIAGNMWDGDHR